MFRTDICYIEALGFLPMTRCTDDPIAYMTEMPGSKSAAFNKLRSQRRDPLIATSPSNFRGLQFFNFGQDACGLGLHA